MQRRVDLRRPAGTGCVDTAHYDYNSKVLAVPAEAPDEALEQLLLVEASRNEPSAAPQCCTKLWLEVCRIPSSSSGFMRLRLTDVFICMHCGTCDVAKNRWHHAATCNALGWAACLSAACSPLAGKLPTNAVPGRWGPAFVAVQPEDLIRPCPTADRSQHLVSDITLARVGIYNDLVALGWHDHTGPPPPVEEVIILRSEEVDLFTSLAPALFTGTLAEHAPEGCPVRDHVVWPYGGLDRPASGCPHWPRVLAPELLGACTRLAPKEAEEEWAKCMVAVEKVHAFGVPVGTCRYLFVNLWCMVCAGEARWRQGNHKVLQGCN